MLKNHASLLLLFVLPIVWCYNVYTHDNSFIPNAVLRVSARNISIGGIHRYTTLVNGSSPGPELRFQEGNVVWVRVYNDMSDANLTMV